MSQNESNKVEGLAEEDKEVKITPEDARGALDFFKHFDIPYPASMQAAFDEFCANPTYENQYRLKFELVRTITTSDHEAFKDEMFKKIVEEVNDTTYEMQFEADLEKTLAENDSK